MNKTDEQLAAEAKSAFDQSVDGLDAATLSRLNRGRHAALAEASRSGREWRRWAPAPGVAAAALLLVFTMRGPGEIDALTGPATDLEILLSEESIEMLEDLEFYSWLDTQELDGSADVG